MGDRVDDTGIGLMLQRHTIGDASPIADIGEHVYQQGIVEHGVVKEILLLCRCQLLVRSDAPTVVLEETAEGFIVSREDGLGARTAQCLFIT